MNSRLARPRSCGASTPGAAEAERDRMVHPHTSMSLGAVLVLTVVVLVTVGGWLWVVFRAGNQA